MQHPARHEQASPPLARNLCASPRATRAGKPTTSQKPVCRLRTLYLMFFLLKLCHNSDLPPLVDASFLAVPRCLAPGGLAVPRCLAPAISVPLVKSIAWNAAASLLAVLSAIPQLMPRPSSPSPRGPRPSSPSLGKGAVPELVQCLNFDDCMERSHEVKRYDVFIRMQPAHNALPARSFLLYQGTVRSNVSLAALCRAFVRFCPNVDWVVDIAVADHM